MKNTERIGNDIIDEVRESLGIKRGDTSKDDRINNMSPNEIFNRWCKWNGFINYSETFRAVIGSIYGVDIDYDTMKLRQDREDAMVIVEEILKMVTLADNHFEENMHEYMCNRLDISSKYLDDIVEVVLKMNTKVKSEK